MACALPKPSVYDVYNGRAVVICNSHFNPHQHLPDIDFTNDVKLAKHLLQNLQIKQTEHHENITALQMTDVLRKVAESVQPETDCLLCVLLSHGKSQDTLDGDLDAIYATDDTILLRDLMGIWNCDRLEGKPKIFIVVACRGSAWSDPVTVKSGRDELHRPLDKPSSQHLGVSVCEDDPSLGPGEMGNTASNERSTVPSDVPVWKDFILIYTTQPGYAAPRPVPGRQPYSPLLKALVDQASERTDFIKMVTYALRDVAYGYEDCEKKLMPWLASRLTKDIIFGRH